MNKIREKMPVPVYKSELSVLDGMQNGMGGDGA